MSAADAKKFVDMVNQNPDLQKQVQQVKGALIDLAQKNGLNMTSDELHDELRSRWEVDKPKDDPDTCTII